MLDSSAALTPVVLALRNLRVRWLRTLLTALGIVIGVAVILAISSANASTLAAIRRVFDEAGGSSSLVVEDSAIAGDGIDQDLLARVTAFPEVLAAAPSVNEYTLPAAAAAGWQYSFGLGGTASGNELQLTGVDPVADPEVRHYRLTAGRFLAPDASEDETYEIVLVESYAADQHVSLGDDFAIIVPGGAVRLRVVGLLAKEGPGVTNSGAVAFAPLRVVQDLFNRGTNVDAIDVVVERAIAEDPRALQDLRSRLAARLGRGVGVSLPATRGEQTAARLQTYQLGLNFFSVVALFVGAFLIYNAFTMTVVERTREIGMLRTLGLTRAQTLQLVLVEALLLGVAGSLAGVAFGLALSHALMGTMSIVSGTPIEEVAVPLDGLAGAAVVGLGVTLAAALLPALQAGRISPLQALRAAGTVDEGRWVRLGWRYGPVSTGLALALIYVVPLRDAVAFPVGSASIFVLLIGVTLCVPLVAGLLEGFFSPLIAALYGAAGLLGARNVQRAKGRTTLTVAALMIGIAMIIGIAGMTGGFRRQIQDWIDGAIGGDLIVRSPLRMRPQVATLLGALPGVDVVTPAVALGVRAEPPGLSSDILLYVGVDLDTYLQMGSFQFEPGSDPEAAYARLRQGGALLVSTTVAQRYGLAPGATLRLVTARGRRDLAVAGVITDFTSSGLIVYGTLADVRALFGIGQVDRFTLKLKPGADRAAVQELIEDRLAKSRHLTVESNAEFKQRILEFADQTFVLFDVLALIGLVVAALGVINTMLMNVLERQREIGALRSLGMTRGQIARMILAEAGMLGLIGGAFGIVAGLLLAGVFARGVGAINGYRIPAIFPTNAVLGGAVIALVVSQLAALWPAWRAASVNIIAAVKHE